eukprot:4984996-Pyramimonas_sp.AAC.2
MGFGVACAAVPGRSPQHTSGGAARAGEALRLHVQRLRRRLQGESAALVLRRRHGRHTDVTVVKFTSRSVDLLWCRCRRAALGGKLGHDAHLGVLVSCGVGTGELRVCELG